MILAKSRPSYINKEKPFAMIPLQFAQWKAHDLNDDGLLQAGLPRRQTCLVGP